MREHRGVRRIPLKEAAAALGISKDAVRQRIRRGTLRSDKEEDGRVYVYLAASVYDVHDDAPREAAGSALVDELRDRVRYLERQVEEEREARRRADTLLARLMDRVPELGPPEEQPEAPETVEEEREEAEPRSDAPGQQEGVRQQQAQRPTEGAEHDAGTLREWSGDVALRQPQEGAQRRPWWRRMFGG